MEIPFFDIKNVTPEDRLFALKMLHDSMARKLANEYNLWELGMIENEISAVLKQNPGLKAPLRAYTWS